MPRLRLVRMAFVLLGSLLITCSAVQAATIYVDSSAPPNGTGASWNKAFRTLQPALKKATSGDVIRIARGVYKPAGSGGDRNRTFIVRDGVTLHGGFAGRRSTTPNRNNPDRFITRLSGDLNGDDALDSNGQQLNRSDNSIHVLVMKNVGRSTQLRGLIISGGYADSFDSNSHKSMGGGLMCFGSAKPTISNCVFEDNFASWFGAGMRANSSPLVKSTDFRNNQTGFANGMGAGAWLRNGIVQNCTFERNVGGIASTGGGGINGQRLRITNCTFQANVSGGVACGDGTVVRNSLFINNGAEDGGGLIIHSGSAAVIECDFLSNSAASFGGAVFARDDAEISLINCRLLGNQSTAGAAIFNRGTLRAVNCVMTGNTLVFGGSVGTIWNFGTAHLTNCTIAFNSNTFASAAITNEGSLRLENSILWGNDSDGLVNEESQLQQQGGDLTLMHNCISGWSGDMAGVNCFGENPHFISPAGQDGVIGTDDDDLRLANNSPARDAGANALLPDDEFDLDRDQDRQERLPVDIEGLPRVVGGQVDLGAHEVQGG